MKKRLDLLLSERGDAPSRTKAQDLIRGGFVRVNGVVQKDVKFPTSSDDLIELLESDELKFVSRGGLKLEGGLSRIGLSVQGLTALDIGISTGGFTDCLLKSGAAQVVGVDVGQNQLHEQLKSDPRVICLEKINAREVHQNQDLQRISPHGWQLIVIDVSFISLELILPSVFEILADQGRVLALVKPQFEVGPHGLNKQGIVKDSGLYQAVEDKLRRIAAQIGFSVLEYFESSISGKDGNQEFFIFLSRSSNHLIDLASKRKSKNED